MGLYPKALTEYIALSGIPRSKGSKIFIVDTEQGDDDNNGQGFERPLLTLAAAEDLCTANKNDVVLMVGRATSDAPAAAIAWDKSYTHLVGMSADLPGMGQRVRIVNTAANDLATLFTLSGNGCIVKNVQFFDGKDKAEVGACLLVSGSRNFLKNVFAAGMGDATASGPATRAGSYSCKITGAENFFEDSTIGLDTIARSAANAELIIAGARNRFRRCDIRSWSVTAGKFLVAVDNSGGDLRDTIFDDVLFFNYTPNWANGIDNVFSMPVAGNSHYVILRGNCQLVGVNSGWADNLTHIYGGGPAPNAGFGLSVNPTT